MAVLQEDSICVREHVSVYVYLSDSADTLLIIEVDGQ